MIDSRAFDEGVEETLKRILVRYINTFKTGEFDYATREMVKRKGEPSFEDFIKWLGLFL